MTETSTPHPLSATDLVLIADDEAFSRFITIELFDLLGKPKIMTARDGTEALAALNGERAAAIRVVVLDFNMPGANGIEVLKEIRSGRLAVPHDVIVMMITSIENLVLVTAAVALDVDVFLTKPTTVANLRRHLIDLLDGERDCATPEHYAALDMNWLSAKGMAEIDVTGAEEIALDDLTEGMVIAGDLLDPFGGLLVAAGTRVTPRLLRLLHGLEAAGLKLVGLKALRSPA